MSRPLLARIISPGASWFPGRRVTLAEEREEMCPTRLDLENPRFLDWLNVQYPGPITPTKRTKTLRRCRSPNMKKPSITDSRRPERLCGCGGSGKRIRNCTMQRSETTNHNLRAVWEQPQRGPLLRVLGRGVERRASFETGASGSELTKPQPTRGFSTDASRYRVAAACSAADVGKPSNLWAVLPCSAVRRGRGGRQK
jgi:hypothetical protein